MQISSLRTFTDDVDLASGCARGEPNAVRHFASRVAIELEPVFARLRVPPCDRADLRQALLERLLVDSETRVAKIRSYRGQGPISNWVRVCAVREVLSQRRRRRPSLWFASEAATGEDDDPEALALQSEGLEYLGVALRRALAERTPQERWLLRRYLVDGHSSQAIAKDLGIHRVTVVRRIQRILADLRQRLDAELGQAPWQVDPSARFDLDLGLASSLARCLNSDLP